MGTRDERVKLTGTCLYCGDRTTSMDHLIPRFKDGPESADNLLPACRSCNSSKGPKDVFEWAASKGFFPLGVTRRYLVLAWSWCERTGLLDQPKKTLEDDSLPFRLHGINWSRDLPIQRIRPAMRRRRRARTAREDGRHGRDAPAAIREATK